MLNYSLSNVHRVHIAERTDNSSLYSDLVRTATNRVQSDAISSSSGVPHKEKDGLGRFPVRVESVSAALLFNSGENPYKNYDSFNNLESVSMYRGALQTQQKQTLAAAPTTIAEGIELPMFSGLQFDYRPDLGVVPSFSLPQHLDLKNIANITFDASQQQASIAPSATAQFELPSFGLAQQTTAANKPKNALQSSQQSPQQQQSQQDASHTPTMVMSNQSMAPPPVVASPPVPPPSPITATDPITAARSRCSWASCCSTGATSQKPLLPPQAQERGSLLDSIRQGLTLKKVDSAAQQDAPAGGGGNDIQSLIFAGIKRHAALMNGQDPDEVKKPTTAATTTAKNDDSLTSKFANIQKRLDQYQDEESTETDDPDDW